MVRSLSRMQADGRSLAKAERHRLIGSLIARKRIGTQHELLSALASAGCRVTQATVSRDIRELRLEKRQDALGHPRFTRQERAAKRDSREVLAGVLGRFGERVTAAQNIVVIQSELGSAPAIGRALDQLAHPQIVGTLAGDDTCLVIARNAAHARRLAQELERVLPLS